ncbi:hypothetical protein MYX82_04885 [Acidobacteria bacterium AH-259-D05]|nr:hypothetical protein [Acidobacteria bacterium AH-259-D05]
MKRIFSGSLVVLFGLGGTLLWSQEDSKWEHGHGPLTHHVAVLLSGTNAGETMLSVDWVAPGTVDQVILIEDRDHGRREITEVKHIYGSHLLLKERLEGTYLAGSRLYQAP